MRYFGQVMSATALLFFCQGSWANPETYNEFFEITTSLDGEILGVGCDAELYDFLLLEGEIRTRIHFQGHYDRDGIWVKNHLNVEEIGWATAFGLITGDSYIATIQSIQTGNNNSGIDGADLMRRNLQNIRFVSKGGGRNIVVDYFYLIVRTPDGEYRVENESFEAFCTPQ